MPCKKVNTCKAIRATYIKNSQDARNIFGHHRRIAGRHNQGRAKALAAKRTITDTTARRAGYGQAGHRALSVMAGQKQRSLATRKRIVRLMRPAVISKEFNYGQASQKYAYRHRSGV